jgi:two-component system LytT family response regulator
MKGIRAIIVDDEINARENIFGILEKQCPEVRVVSQASSALEAIESILLHKPDLVFLDIEMPGGNGFKVLEHFPHAEFGVIFITAYDHYAIQAIRFSALDYILKPINMLQLKAALKKYIELQEQFDIRLRQFMNNQKIAQEDQKIALPFVNKIEYVEIKKIISCKGEANYTRICLTNGKSLLVSKPLIEYEEILESYGFIRTHKSHLVNLRHVVSFIKNDNGSLLMSDNTSIPVSRRKKEFVLEKLKAR